MGEGGDRGSVCGDMGGSQSINVCMYVCVRERVCVLASVRVTLLSTFKSYVIKLPEVSPTLIISIAVFLVKAVRLQRSHSTVLCLAC